MTENKSKLYYFTDQDQRKRLLSGTRIPTRRSEHLSGVEQVRQGYALLRDQYPGPGCFVE